MTELRKPAMESHISEDQAATAESNQPFRSEQLTELPNDSKSLAMSPATLGVSSPSRGLTEDSGNFSETTDVGNKSPSLAAATNSTKNTIYEMPRFSIGSPCLELSRVSSASLVNNIKTENVTEVLSCSSFQDVLTEIPLGSAPEDGNSSCASLPNITLTGDDNPTPSACKSDSYLGLLAENFHAFYQQKLADIEHEGGSDNQNAYFLKRNSILKAWINDLVEQNHVLIETVEEMEREAGAKIVHLDGKLYQSSQMAAKHMTIIQEYEQQVQHLLAQRSSFEEEAGELRSEVAKMRNKGDTIEEKLNTMEAENEKLVTLITRIRDWGVWDISDLQLSQRSYYRIFELYPSLAGSEVQTVFTRERARQVNETAEQLENLKATLEDLRDFKAIAEETLNEKENVISDFRRERDELMEKLKSSLAENAEYKRSLDETKHVLATMTMRTTTAISTPRTSYSNQNSDFSHRDHEMTEMLKELRDLRDQLSLACAERQNAVAEATSLKFEMNSRLEEVQQMKNMLLNIQNEAQHTRSKVQDVQDKQSQLTALKTQVQCYQQKYEEARDMLNSKSDMIQSLQRQMDMLHTKVVKIEFDKSRTNTPTPAPQETSSKDVNNEKRPKRSRHPSEKPPWNEHFLKDGSLEQDTRLFIEEVSGKKSDTQMLPVRKSSLILAREKCERRRQQAMKHDFMENHKKLNARLLGQRKYLKEKKSSEKFATEPSNLESDNLMQPCVSTNSARCSYSSPAASERYQKVAQYFSDRLGIVLDGDASERRSPTPSTGRVREEVKLPPIHQHDKGRKLDSRESKNSRKEKTPSRDQDQDRLPRLVEKPKDSKPDSPYSPNQNCGSGCKTLDALVSEAVRASRQMIESFDPSKGKMSMRVRASHRHRHVDDEHDRKPPSERDTMTMTSSSYRNRNRGDIELASMTEPKSEARPKTLYKDDAKPRKPTNFEMANEVKIRSSQYRKPKLSESLTDPRLRNKGREGERDDDVATGILAGLPSESQEYLVKNWIYKNASSTTLAQEEYPDYELEGGSKSEMSMSNATYVVGQNRRHRGNKTSHTNSAPKKYGKQFSSQTMPKATPDHNGYLPNREAHKMNKVEAEREHAYYSTSSFSQHSLDSLN